MKLLFRLLGSAAFLSALIFGLTGCEKKESSTNSESAQQENVSAGILAIDLTNDLRISLVNAGLDEETVEGVLLGATAEMDLIIGSLAIDVTSQGISNPVKAELFLGLVKGAFDSFASDALTAKDDDTKVLISKTTLATSFASAANRAADFNLNETKEFNAKIVSSALKSILKITPVRSTLLRKQIATVGHETMLGSQKIPAAGENPLEIAKESTRGLALGLMVAAQKIPADQATLVSVMGTGVESVLKTISQVDLKQTPIDALSHLSQSAIDSLKSLDGDVDNLKIEAAQSTTSAAIHSIDEAGVAPTDLTVTARAITAGSLKAVKGALSDSNSMASASAAIVGAIVEGVGERTSDAANMQDNVAAVINASLQILDEISDDTDSARDIVGKVVEAALTGANKSPAFATADLTVKKSLLNEILATAVESVDGSKVAADRESLIQLAKTITTATYSSLAEQGIKGSDLLVMTQAIGAAILPALKEILGIEGSKDSLTDFSTSIAEAAQEAQETIDSVTKFTENELVITGALSFGKVYLNTSLTQSVTLKNNGVSTVDLTFGGLSAPFTLQASGCSKLLPGQSCIASVIYLPTLPGAAAGSLSVNYGGFSKGLAISATAVQLEMSGNGSFVSTVVGASSSKTFTLVNPGVMDLTIQTPALGNGYTIANHNCTPLAKLSQCSLQVQFAPASAGAASSTLQVNVAAISKNLSITLSGQGTAPALLSLDNPTQSGFSGLLVGSSQTVTFSLSHGGDVPATNIGFSLADPFSIQSTTCGTSLATGPCTLTVEFEASEVGSFVEDLVISYHNGTATQTLTKSLNASALSTLTVAPTFSVAPQWLDYALTSNTALGCDGTAHCLHGGEYKTVAVSFFDSCTNLTLEDSLGAFGWHCHDLGDSVEFRTTRLKVGTKLESLLLIDESPHSWRTMSVSLKNSGNEVAVSLPTAWWSNPVIDLPDTTAAVVAADGHDLAAEGTIFVVTSNTLTNGIEIMSQKQAVVVFDGFYLRMQASGVTDAVIDDGVGIKYVWLEGEIQANARPTRVIQINDATSTFWTLRNVNATRSIDIGIYLTGNRCRLENVGISVNSQHGLYLESDACTFYNLKTTNNGGHGLVVTSGSTNNIFVNTLTAGNQSNIYLNSQQRNTFLNTVNVNSPADGMHITSMSYNRNANLLLLNHTGNGISTAENSGTNYNEWVQTVALAVDGYALFYRNGLSNIFRDLFVVDSNKCHFDNGAAGKFNVDLLCEEDTTLTTGVVRILEGPVDISSSFVGYLGVDGDSKSSLDNSNATVSAADLNTNNAWGYVDDFLRSWSKDGSVWPASGVRGSCTAGNCRIFDWRLKSTDQVFLNRSIDSSAGTFTNGNTCPADVHGDKWLESASLDVGNLGGKFLYNATELPGIGNGDNDGLCESGESCLYSRNLGIYQGHGDYMTVKCNFVDSASTGIIGVTMYAYPLNGI